MTESRKSAASAGSNRDRKEELFLRAALDHAADGMLVFKTDGSCRYINPAARELLGIAVPAPDFRPPELWRSRIAQVIARGEPASFDDYLTSGSSVHVVESSWAPWPDHQQVSGGVGAVFRDVTDRHRLAAERRLLAQRLLEVQEQERKNISQFLHDHMGPLLLLAKMDLEQLSNTLSADQRELLQQALARMDDALRGIRHKALAVRPPLLDDLAVNEALEFVVDDFVQTQGLPVDLAPVPLLPALSPSVKTCLFRVLQEALSNVVAHAQATATNVVVEKRARALAMVIRDNGCGFDVQAVAPSRQLGLIGMREIVHSLGGDLLIQSEPGRGTCVEVVVPLDEMEMGGSR